MGEGRKESIRLSNTGFPISCVTIFDCVLPPVMLLLGTGGSFPPALPSSLKSPLLPLALNLSFAFELEP